MYGVVQQVYSVVSPDSVIRLDLRPDTGFVLARPITINSSAPYLVLFMCFCGTQLRHHNAYSVIAIFILSGNMRMTN